MAWLIFAGVCWYASGVFLAFATMRAIDPVIRVKDVVVCVATGFIGPIHGLYWLIYSDWGEKPVFGKKSA